MEGYKYTATEVGHRKLEPPPPYLPPLPGHHEMKLLQTLQFGWNGLFQSQGVAKF